jgi:hypothetical protein
VRAGVVLLHILCAARCCRSRRFLLVWQHRAHTHTHTLPALAARDDEQLSDVYAAAMMARLARVWRQCLAGFVRCLTARALLCFLRRSCCCIGFEPTQSHAPPMQRAAALPAVAGQRLRLSRWSAAHFTCCRCNGLDGALLRPHAQQPRRAAGSRQKQPRGSFFTRGGAFTQAVAAPRG